MGEKGTGIFLAKAKQKVEKFIKELKNATNNYLQYRGKKSSENIRVSEREYDKGEVDRP